MHHWGQLIVGSHRPFNALHLHFIFMSVCIVLLKYIEKVELKFKSLRVALPALPPERMGLCYVQRVEMFLVAKICAMKGMSATMPPVSIDQGPVIDTVRHVS